MAASSALVWDVQDHLKTPEDCLLFLQAAFDDAGDDPTAIVQAVEAVVRSVGMAQAVAVNPPAAAGVEPAQASGVGQ